VATAFLQVLLQKELLEIAHEQIALTNENIRRRNELIKSGKMAQGEIYELEAQPRTRGTKQGTNRKQPPSWHCSIWHK